MKHVVERFKQLQCSRVCVAISMPKGLMNLRVDRDGVEVTTYYKDLVVPTINDQQTPATTTDADHYHEVMVDIRDLGRALTCAQMYPQHAICCIYQDRLFALHAYSGPLPAVNDVMDDDDEGDHEAVVSYYLRGLID
jgi:hypothetical protein